MSSPKMIPVVRMAFTALFLAVTGLLPAISVTIYPTADTTLFETSPDDNLGAVLTFIAGTTAGGERDRALLRFDPAEILPPSAIVQSVTLTLNVTKTVATAAHQFRLHRMVRDWSEGSGVSGTVGSLALPGETAWNERLYPDELWAEPGGGATNDYAADSSAETMIFEVGQYEFTSSNLVADVSRWLTNAGNNFGWMLICADEAAVPSARRFGSREDPSYGPQLRIEYQLPEHPVAVLVPVADAALFEHHPDNNLGASDLAAGSIGVDTHRTRALLRFDLSSLPPDASLLSASLHMFVTRSGSGPGSNFLLHRLRRSWGEGDRTGLDGSPAAGGDSTWIYRFYPYEPWETPGAQAGEDYAPESTAQTFGNYGEWIFTNVLTDLNFWRGNPGTNFGWIMISDNEETPRTARRLGSRENGDFGPYLLIDYTQLPHMDHAAISDGTLGFSFEALAFRQYRIECRAQLDSGTWQTWTNLPLPTAHGPVAVSVPITGLRKFYRVALDP